MTRRRLSVAEKARLLDKQDGKCVCAENCGETLIVGQIDYDHRIPISMGGTNDFNNFQALVKGHHGEKTKHEATERAKADRAGAKHRGEWLSKDDRELQRRIDRTKYL